MAYHRATGVLHAPWPLPRRHRLGKMADEDSARPAFSKPKGGRSFRKRKVDADESDAVGSAAPEQAEPEQLSSLQAMRELQRQRQRQRGVTLEAKGELDIDEQVGRDGVANEEPGDVAAVLDATFTQQTEAGDVDPNMLKYIEEAMGTRQDGDGDEAAGGAPDDDEDELYTTPAFLQPKPSAQAAAQGDREDAQRWLAGIEEVALSVEDKLCNVEATERAKAKMLDKLEAKMRRGTTHPQERSGGPGGSANQRDQPALPGNFTSNFAMHRKSARTGRIPCARSQGCGRTRRGTHTSDVPDDSVCAPRTARAPTLARRFCDGTETRRGPRRGPWRWFRPPLSLTMTMSIESELHRR